ncbi:MAG TPA: hypothetical protein VLC79_06650 [Cellvibrio sp.]|nr:hypothetical protein [Cellvibrio sp.]
MNMCSDHEKILAETLRKVGRNLYNYQQVEKIWNLHIKNRSIKTTIGQDGVPVVKKPESSKRALPMGWVAENYRKALYASDTESEDQSEEFSISSKFSIEAEFDALAERRKQMLQVVRERNLLVHSLVERLDAKSTESLIILGRELDEENERTISEIEQLNEMSKFYIESMKLLEELLKSKEFVNELTK